MADLQIVISALNTASEEIGNVKEDIDGIGTSSQDASPLVEGFGAMLGTALGIASTIAIGVKAVAEGITAVIDAASEAAELDFAAMQFDNLTASIGETSNAVMTDLQVATQGMISDAELQAGAAQLISSGYAHSSEELATFGEIAAGLNVPFTDMAKLAGGTGKALQNMGIDISGVEGRVDDLVNAGWDKSAAQVTANTEAMQRHVEVAGSAADTEIALFKKLDAAKANTAAANSEVASSAGTLFAQMGLQAHQTWQSSLAYEDLRYQLKEANIDFSDEAAVFQKLTPTMEEQNAALESMAVKLYGAEYALSNFSKAELANIDTVANSTSSYEDFVDVAHRSGVNIEGITEAVYDEVMALKDINDTPLEDKEGTATYTLEDDEVKNYNPPTKYATVVYSAGGGGGGGGGGAMYEAVGGSVNAGQPYTWQEYGYRGEVFVPSADGFVLSRADAERALAKALYGGGSAVDPAAIGKAIAQAMSGVTAKGKGGNVYNLTMPTSSNPADVRTAFELMEAWNA